MTNAKLDNGPVDFTKELGHQGLTKKSKLDQDARYINISLFRLCNYKTSIKTNLDCYSLAKMLLGYILKELMGKEIQICALRIIAGCMKILIKGIQVPNSYKLS